MYTRKRKMFLTLTVFQVFLTIALCGEESSTHWPELDGQKYPGAARQTYGSKSIQSLDDPYGYKKHNRPKNTRMRDRQEEDEDHHGHGVVKYGVSAASDAQPKSRFGNNNGPPMHAPSGQMYEMFNRGAMSERRDSGYYGGRINHRGGHNTDEYVPQQHDFTEDLDEMSSNHNSGADEEGTCEISCEPSEFICEKSCHCIHGDLHCNEVIDCGPDGEDEMNCELTEEGIKKIRVECESSPNHILCPNTLICISQHFLCDGDDDCGDWSDETNCGMKNNCSSDQFECFNGLCVQSSWVCDGENDCRDMSDEQNCTRTCNTDEFQCADLSSCVSLGFRCDLDADCGDESDEADCDFPMSICPEGEFKCKGLMGGMGGPGGRCVLQRFVCDGFNDCLDNSDEENCPARNPTCAAGSEFKCDDNRCIPLRWQCDSEQDCDSGEDEKGCSDIGNKNNNRECTDEEYTCKDGRCIFKSWVCDSIEDCKRGEDELECDIKCDAGQFLCPSKSSEPRQKGSNICINQKHVCDGGLRDCPGGEDEENCPTIHSCPANTKCEQMCSTSAAGKEECSCKVGFLLHENGHNCTDIDECQFTMNPVCSQRCENTRGGFRCGCINGYVLRPDLRTCKALGGAVKLLMANRGDIRTVTLSNNQYTSIIKNLPNAISLDYHYAKDLLFWSDVSSDVIKKSFLNGTGMKDVIKWGLESPGGIAVDWIHQLLFWTDSGTRRVEVSTFDGNLRAVIVSNDLDKPRAIVVHPGEALVFWTDWGPNAKIERAYMDGSERVAITNEGIYWPNGLTIDYATNRIYWADAKHHVIESTKLDGGDRKKIMSNNLPHPFALTIFEDALYWTDWHTKTISTANKVTGKNYRHVHEGLHYPMDIHSYHVARQPLYVNRCAEDKKKMKGGCSHLCLPTRNSRRCSCPIGLTLLGDQKTCTTVPDKLLLIARKKDIRIRQLDSNNPSKEIDMVIPLDGLKSVVALDWDGENDQVFWSDVGRSTISRAHLNGSNEEVIIQSNLVSPAGIAYDWVTRKIYFTDAGTNRIEVASVHVHYQRALLVWQNLQKPRDIVVNPIAGIMFWSDWGDNKLIERANMDGSGRLAICTKDLMYPNGLAIDFSNNQLFFVDAGTKALESINFDGSGRTRLITDGLQHPFGLDVHDKSILWSDWESQSIQMADKSTGKNRKNVISNTSDLMDIRVFHRKRRVMRNPCGTRNGGCSHICLLKPEGFSCACPIGVKLTSDLKTCKDGPSSYVLFAHRVDIRQISLDINYLIDVVLPLPTISNVISLDVDRKTGDIYYADTIEDTIVKSTSDGLDSHQIISESMDNVDGLVIDSIGRKIYWCDAGRHSIEVSELDGNNRKVLLFQDLESPRALTIDYEQGYLFFSDWGSNARIERADMDGGKRSRIVTNGLTWPNGLAVDHVEKLLFWTDAKLGHIEFSDFNGNFRKIVVKDLPHPYGIAVTRTHVYWSDWKSLALHTVEKKNLTNRSIAANNLEFLMDVKVVDIHEKLLENACGPNNGNCSHLCLRKPGTPGFSCQCPTGIKLKANGKDCEELPNSYLLIALRSGIGRISLDTPEMFDVVLPIDGVHGAVVVDYHYNKSYIFYADVNVDAIRRVNMKNCSDTKTIISSGLNTPNGLAVDWLANNIYFSDTIEKVIEVCRLDGSSRKTLIKEDLDDPRAIILYPKTGFMFWADWSHIPRIERALMDGTERKKIINSNLGFPTGLAIDFTLRKLYWADALRDLIESSDFDGKKRNIIVNHAEHPFGFTLTNSYFYWTDWYNKSVIRSPKRAGGGPIEEVRHSLRGALEIRSVSAERQPDEWNPCAQENGGCSHLCFFKESSYVCGCPNIPDSRFCKSEPSFHVPMKKVDDRPPNYTSTAETPSESSAMQTKLTILIVALSLLLLIVVIVLVGLVLQSKKNKSPKAPVTYGNPNYNANSRLHYNKAQDCVYEERALGCGPETATTTLMSSANPSPMPSHSGILSTIG